MNTVVKPGYLRDWKLLLILFVGGVITIKITFPHMGTMWVPVKGMLEHLGLEVIVPPPCTRKTLSLGVRHSPEFACLPFKINIEILLKQKQWGQILS